MWSAEPSAKGKEVVSEKTRRRQVKRKDNPSLVVFELMYPGVSV
jgi:hypothetical protein